MSSDHVDRVGCATRRAFLLAGPVLARDALAAPVVDRESFPTRPVTVIVPFPAGGTTDHIIRVLSRLTAEAVGQAFIVDNRPGASTLIAAHTLARAKPDGYTIGVVPMLLNRLRALGRTALDPVRDFSLIARVAGQTHGLVVRADSAHRSVSDIVRAARARPGEITYGTSGVASLTHGAMEDFSDLAGIQLRHIPFRGGSDSLRALMGGEIDLLAESPLWAAEVDAGRARLLTIWSAARSDRFPHVPTMTEQGYATVVEGAIGIGGPPGIDQQVLERLRRIFRAQILGALFKAECARLLAPVLYLDGDAFVQYARENADQERALVQRLGARLGE